MATDNTAKKNKIEKKIVDLEKQLTELRVVVEELMKTISEQTAKSKRGKVLEAYGVWKQKNMMGRKFMGIERSTFIIDAQGKIAAVYNKVKVNGHVDEILDFLKRQ